MQAITIKDLINYLQDEDPNSTVIYQYYTAEHFDTTEDVFSEVAMKFDSLIPALYDAHDCIAETVAELSGDNNA